MTNTAWSPARRRGRPPASDSAVTRQRILHAAEKVFADSGYEAATFQAIAIDIGLTRPAINNYFNSKSALYAAVVGRVNNAVLDAIHEASEAPTLAEQVLEFIRRTLRGGDAGGGANPSVAGFLVQGAMDAQHLPGRDCEAAALIERFLRASVAAAVDRGEIDPDTEGLADALMGMVLGTAFQLSRGGARNDRMLDQFGAVLGQGLQR